jgi:hypothetical protein
VRLTTRRFVSRLLLIAVTALVLIVALFWLYSESIVDRSILTDLPCAAPCWQGISPGSSLTREDAIQRVETLPDVWHIWQPILGDISWHWSPWPGRQRTGASSIDLIGSQVNNITVSYAFYLTIAEILDKYGLPETTNWGPSSLPEDTYLWMNLFYPTRGLQFAAMVETRNDAILVILTAGSSPIRLCPIRATHKV